MDLFSDFIKTYVPITVGSPPKEKKYITYLIVFKEAPLNMRGRAYTQISDVSDDNNHS